MKRKVISYLLAAAMVLSFAGCGNNEASSKEEAKDATAETKVEETAEAKKQDSEANADKENLKFVYVSKMLSHPWFLQEEMGIKKACEELGIEYVGIDSNQNDEQCLSDVDSAITMEADVLLICMTNQSMGPNIAQKCKEEGIAMVTIDDNVVDETGAAVPHVGMPTKEVGELGGQELAKMANERGYFDEGNKVKVLQIDVPTTTVFAPRLEGYREALMKDTPLKEEDFIVVDTTEGMYEDVLEAASPIIVANPDVTHWIVTGANDDCALAPVAVLQEQGFDMDNTLACGLGGYEQSLEQFKAGNKNYIAIVLRPDEEGYQAVKIAYDYIVNGTEMPENTYVNGSIANSDNYLDYYPNGKLVTDQ